MISIFHHYNILTLLSMDWFKGKSTGKPQIYWENLWFPVDFPLNQSIDFGVLYIFPRTPIFFPVLPWQRQKHPG
jgi:hypothetical protein